MATGPLRTLTSADGRSGHQRQRRPRRQRRHHRHRRRGSELTADTSGISDADGLGAFSYQWLRNGTNIAGATSSTYTPGDLDVGTNDSVVVSYTDGNETLRTLTSARVGPVINVNDDPVGNVVITGTVARGSELTADTSGISDADGLGAFSYQWLRNGTNIAGATSSTYTPGDLDVGTNISVVVSYTDGNGTTGGH